MAGVYKPSNPTSLDLLPLERFGPKVPEPSQTMSLTGNQVFKHMTLHSQTTKLIVFKFVHLFLCPPLTSYFKKCLKIYLVGFCIPQQCALKVTISLSISFLVYTTA